MSFVDIKEIPKEREQEVPKPRGRSRSGCWRNIDEHQGRGIEREPEQDGIKCDPASVAKNQAYKANWRFAL